MDNPALDKKVAIDVGKALVFVKQGSKQTPFTQAENGFDLSLDTGPRFRSQNRYATLSKSKNQRMGVWNRPCQRVALKSYSFALKGGDKSHRS